MPEATPDLILDAARALYAGSPSEFIAHRTELVKAAKAAGDKDAAREIGQLRRPDVAAWAVNVVVREHPEVVAALAGLGARMRAAQSTLDAAALQGMRGERDEALARLVSTAVTALAERGHPLTPAAQDAVRETGIAMLADPGASDAVASGLLRTGLTYSGFGEVDISDAIAVTSSGAVLTALTGGGDAAPEPVAPADTAPTRMRAVTYSEFGGRLTVTEVDIPDIPPGGALVRVEATGLCRSDWHGWMGHDADITSFPHVPGHEFAGTVTEVGTGVDPAWIGRRVTAPFVYACGTCSVCADGDGQVCPHQEQPGFSLPGSFAQYVVVTAATTNLVELPDDLSSREAAALGCRVATAYRALVARAKVTAGEQVAIFGCGGVGLSAVAIAVSRGATVIVVDPNPAALELASTLGAAHCIPAGQAALTAISEASGGGVQVAMDAFGSPATCRDSILALQRRGRQVQVGLLGQTDCEVPMSRIIGWEITVLGSHGMPAADYTAMLGDIATGRISLGALLSTGPMLSLEEAAEAVPEMATVGATPGIRVIDPWL